MDSTEAEAERDSKDGSNDENIRAVLANSPDRGTGEAEQRPPGRYTTYKVIMPQREGTPDLELVVDTIARTIRLPDGTLFPLDSEFENAFGSESDVAPSDGIESEPHVPPISTQNGEHKTTQNLEVPDNNHNNLDRHVRFASPLVPSPVHTTPYPSTSPPSSPVRTTTAATASGHILDLREMAQRVHDEALRKQETESAPRANENTLVLSGTSPNARDARAHTANPPDRTEDNVVPSHGSGETVQSHQNLAAAPQLPSSQMPGQSMPQAPHHGPPLPQNMPFTRGFPPGLPIPSQYLQQEMFQAQMGYPGYRKMAQQMNGGYMQHGFVAQMPQGQMVYPGQQQMTQQAQMGAHYAQPVYHQMPQRPFQQVHIGQQQAHMGAQTAAQQHQAQVAAHQTHGIPQNNIPAQQTPQSYGPSIPGNQKEFNDRYFDKVPVPQQQPPVSQNHSQSVPQQAGQAPQQNYFSPHANQPSHNNRRKSSKALNAAYRNHQAATAHNQRYIAQNAQNHGPQAQNPQMAYQNAVVSNSTQVQVSQTLERNTLVQVASHTQAFNFNVQYKTAQEAYGKVPEAQYQQMLHAQNEIKQANAIQVVANATAAKMPAKPIDEDQKARIEAAKKRIAEVAAKAEAEAKTLADAEAAKRAKKQAEDDLARRPQAARELQKTIHAMLEKRNVPVVKLETTRPRALSNSTIPRYNKDVQSVSTGQGDNESRNGSYSGGARGASSAHSHTGPQSVPCTPQDNPFITAKPDPNEPRPTMSEKAVAVHEAYAKAISGRPEGLSLRERRNWKPQGSFANGISKIDPVSGLTHIEWAAEEALEFNTDLLAITGKDKYGKVTASVYNNFIEGGEFLHPAHLKNIENKKLEDERIRLETEKQRADTAEVKALIVKGTKVKDIPEELSYILKLAADWDERRKQDAVNAVVWKKAADIQKAEKDAEDEAKRKSKFDENFNPFNRPPPTNPWKSDMNPNATPTYTPQTCTGTDAAPRYAAFTRKQMLARIAARVIVVNQDHTPTMAEMRVYTDPLKNEPEIPTYLSGLHEPKPDAPGTGSLLEAIEKGMRFVPGARRGERAKVGKKDTLTEAQKQWLAKRAAEAEGPQVKEVVPVSKMDDKREDNKDVKENKNPKDKRD